MAGGRVARLRADGEEDVAQVAQALPAAAAAQRGAHGHGVAARQQALRQLVRLHRRAPLPGRRPQDLLDLLHELHACTDTTLSTQILLQNL